MYSKKIFPTACMGFSKNAVLEYIYEQDKLAEDRQANLMRDIDALQSEIASLKELFDDERETVLEANEHSERIKTDINDDMIGEIASLKTALCQAESKNKVLQASVGECERKEKLYKEKLSEQNIAIEKLKKYYNENKFIAVIKEKESIISDLKELNRQLQQSSEGEISPLALQKLALKDIEIKRLRQKNDDLQKLLGIMQDKLSSLYEYTESSVKE